MSGHIQDKRAKNLMVFMCFALYIVLGLARYNYGACLSSILASEPVDKGQAGLISTVNFFAYAVGTGLGGALADRVRPRRLVLLAVILTGCSNLLFFAAGSYGLMLAAWCLNGLAQGPVFCSVMRLLNDSFSRESVTPASIAVQCAFTLGSAVAYAVSALLLRTSGWRTVFLCAGVCALLFALLWHWALGWAEGRRSGPEQVPGAGESAPAPQMPAPSAPRLLGQAGLLMLPLALVSEGVLRDGVSTWGPTYVEEMFSLESALAVASNTVIPAFSVAGIFAANLLKVRLGRSELRCAGVTFAVSAGAMALLLVSAGRSLPLSLALLAVSAACMSGVNAMLINAVPLQFGGFGRTGAVSGILNTLVYAGSGLSTYGIGVVVSSFGWGTANLCWLLLAAASAAVCLLSAGRWQHFKDEHQLL